MSHPGAASAQKSTAGCSARVWSSVRTQQPGQRPPGRRLIHFLTFCHVSSFSLSIDHSLSMCRQTHKYTFCHLNCYCWSHHHLVGLNHLRLASMSWIHSSLFVAQVRRLLIVVASLAEKHRLRSCSSRAQEHRLSSCGTSV